MTVVNVTDATLKGTVTGPTFTGNVDGAKFTGSVTYAVTPPPLVPVISSTEFTIAAGPPLDTLVGKVIASNNPTSYAITGGNTSNYFAIYSSANLRTSETIKVPDAVYPLTVTATNSVGTSAPQTITVTIGDQIPIPPSTITHGQQIVLGNVGRVGAKSAAISGYSDTMTTVTGTKTYSTSQTIRNTTFTGQVIVTGGNVIFEFCLFKAQPPSASSSSGAALQQYNAGAACGTVTCNWCDFDSGLRGTGGNFETEGFNAGQRASVLTNQSASKFTLYRCRVQGFGNGVSIDGWQCAMSFITECYIGDCTSGGGSHMDGIEIYGSDNVTVQRCRMVGVSGGQCVLANVTNDMYSVVNSNPIILQNNMVLPNGDNAPILIARNNANQSFKRNVSVIGNYWGDNSNYGFTAQLAGNESPMTGLNVTFDKAYFDANQASNTPGLVYWDKGNVWTPNGEGVTQKTKGAFVDESNFSNGPSAWTGKVLSGNPAPSGAWPGQAGNPVGFAATPASKPAFTTPIVWPGGTWPGAWPGSFTGGTNPTVNSGTSGSPTIIAFADFTSGIDLSNKHDIVFIGCRWQISANSTYSVQMGGASCARISFFYCTGSPSITAAGAQPPGGGGYTTWPSAGMGTNKGDPTSSIQISSKIGCYVCMELYSHSANGPPGGLIQFDHCDFWGCGAAIAQSGGGSGGTVVTDCWVHDAPYGLPINTAPYDWHINGIADTNYGDLSNVTVRNCTVASLGNTNGIAFQQNGSTHYNNIIVDNCYLSGFGYTVVLGYTSGMAASQTLVRNVQYTNNTISTGLNWTYFCTYGDESNLFISNTHANGNRWHGNKLLVVPGTSAGGSQSPWWTNANNGQFLYPTTSFGSTDWP